MFLTVPMVKVVVVVIEKPGYIVARAFIKAYINEKEEE
jgi:hypothetical protein